MGRYMFAPEGVFADVGYALRTRWTDDDVVALLTSPGAAGTLIPSQPE